MRSSGSMRWPRPTRHCRSRTQTGGALFGLTRALEAEAAIRRAVELGERQLGVAATRLRGLLADSHDAQSRTSEAFVAYTDSDWLQREVNAAQCATASPSALQYALGLVDYLRSADRTRWCAAPPSSGPESPAGDVFVLGFLRSGTALLEVTLEGHAQVASVEESESLIDSMHQFMQQPQDLERLVHAPPTTLDTLRGAYWRRVAQTGVDGSGKVLVDKSPLNILKLSLIARLFPRANTLVTCRDSLDVVRSGFRHRFRMRRPIYEMLTLAGAAHYYDAVMRVLMECTCLLPPGYSLVRHEGVVSGFAREMCRVCDLLGLKWDPPMGEFAGRTHARTPALR